MAAIQALEARSDEELAAETRYRWAAQTILGTRKAEKFDAKGAREHFQKALAAAPPQQRLQIRRMADVSLAMAERRTSDLKAAAAKLPGAEMPSGWNLFLLRVFGLIAPPRSAGILARIRGIFIVIAAIIGVLALAYGIVKLVALPFGGISLDLSIFYGILLVFIALGAAAFYGRRRQKAALAKRRESLAARTGG